MSFSEKPTTKDLSDTKELKGFPAFHSSMAATNTVTDKDPNFAGRGTPSEATQDVVAKDVSYVGYSHEVPDLPGPEAVGDSALGAKEKGTSYSPSAHTWKDCK
jgi:hypothetical protein